VKIETFQTHAVLSLATGTLMGDFSEMHRLIEWFAGGPVWTHQIPRLANELESCAQGVLGDRFEPFDRDTEAWTAYRDRMLAKIGETMEIAQPAKPFHRADAVIADAVEAVGPERVVVVQP